MGIFLIFVVFVAGLPLPYGIMYDGTRYYCTVCKEGGKVLMGTERSMQQHIKSKKHLGNYSGNKPNNGA